MREISQQKVHQMQHLPDHALHKPYQDAGGYADIFHARLSKPATLSELLTAFYTCPVFKIERMILRIILGKGSTDDQARALAKGERTQFAAWDVAQRNETQMLMRDYKGMTLSWFMIEEDDPHIIYFGTAIVAAKGASPKSPKIPLLFSSTLWFHKAYSRALLWSTQRQLEKR
jgi:hypothetical protein